MRRALKDTLTHFSLRRSTRGWSATVGTCHTFYGPHYHHHRHCSLLRCSRVRAPISPRYYVFLPLAPQRSEVRLVREVRPIYLGVRSPRACSSPPVDSAMSRKFCVVALCPSGESDVPYHRFPRESSPRRQRWIDFVRASGRGDAWTPRESSRICSRHFAPSCYKRHPASLARLGLSTKGLYLEPGALPTVYPAVRTPCPPGGSGVAAPFTNRRPRHEPTPPGYQASALFLYDDGLLGPKFPSAKPGVTKAGTSRSPGLTLEHPHRILWHSGKTQCCSAVSGTPAASTGRCRLGMVSKATTTAKLKVDATTQCAVLMTPKATMASRVKLASTVGVQTDRVTEEVGKLKIDATTQCAVLMTPKATMAVRTKRTSTVGLQTGRIIEQMGLRKADVATQCAVPMTLKATQATVNPRSTRTVGIQTTSATNQQLVDFGAVSWKRDLTTSSWR
ncbi:uncharacterized protein [Dermacentor andersoni]|uniref:uncharacterized protein isoform X2 n=1 Tax=Dermacentor andersoni TaxID=34620 RepID=UPI0024180C51|nr:uncharacterized protein LOC126529388 isoform X2 [Dermacentor andersoni]